MATDKLAVFTISDPLYVGLAPTMFASVREHYPEADLFLFMVGTGKDATFADGVHVIYVGDVIDPLDLEQRLCYYLGVEMACSVRPECFQSLFGKGYDRVIYFDPDIYVFRRMSELDTLLDTGVNGVLTPHALKSISSEKNAPLAGGDRIFLQVGIFNLGFLALNNTQESGRMLAWWAGKLKWQCICDTKTGLFVDQKWLEFLPVYFEGFHILRLPTYNLAPWNAEHYKIIKDDADRFYVDSLETPVAFIHFSGIKRSYAHYSKMPEALKFYLKRISASEHAEYNFVPYPVRLQPSGIPWDRLCTFLYRDYVTNNGDHAASPLRSVGVLKYLTSIDPETGVPRYLRKAFEVFPRYAAAVLCDGGAMNLENLIAEMTKKETPYAGCIYPETVEGLRSVIYGTKGIRVAHTEVTAPKEPAHRFPPANFTLARRAMRKARSILARSRLAARAYMRIKSLVIHAFHVNEVRVDPISASSADHLNATLLKIALGQTKDADIVK